jgi:pimeloyl-ACP methyl ester carboxylesterase
VSKMATIHADFLEAGCGPLVMLVHSSVSGARQWRGLTEDLKGHFHVRAVNLFGYGKTPPWPAESRQSLADQARLVEAALPAGTDQICLVGHSFGGAVAMKVAARLSRRVAKLVLLEPIPFQLLAQAGCKDAFAESRELLAFGSAGVLPTREIAAILRRSCPSWTFAEVRGAGHMAPIMRPDLINPLVCSFLESTAQNRELVGV